MEWRAHRQQHRPPRARRLGQVDGALHRGGAEAREGLYQQVPNPVRWMESIRRLAELGAARFVEVGVGSVLTGLLRNIDPGLAGAAFGEPADLEKLAR